VRSPKNVALSVLLFCASVGAWEGLVRLFEVPAFILPPPSQVALALWRGFSSGLYVQHLSHTLLETMLGFIAGSALGLILGTAVALSRPVEFFLYPYIVMFQSLPKVALAPLIVVWFGLGLTSKVINAALIAFFPLLVNTMVGLRSADEERGEPDALARGERAADLLDAAAAEFPALRDGRARRGHDLRPDRGHRGRVRRGPEGPRGMLIQSMNFNMDVSGQFSILLILSVVGLLLNRGVMMIRKRVLFWDPSEKERIDQERVSA
jgi:NitT/TauT family transport system permease protein